MVSFYKPLSLLKDTWKNVNTMKIEIQYFSIISFTDTASRLTGIEKSAFVVYLKESGPEDVGVGKELLEGVMMEKN
jgi:hypothetical protein